MRAKGKPQEFDHLSRLVAKRTLLLRGCQRGILISDRLGLHPLDERAGQLEKDFGIFIAGIAEIVQPEMKWSIEQLIEDEASGIGDGALDLQRLARLWIVGKEIPRLSGRPDRVPMQEHSGHYELDFFAQIERFRPLDVAFDGLLNFPPSVGRDLQLSLFAIDKCAQFTHLACRKPWRLLAKEILEPIVVPVAKRLYETEISVGHVGGHLAELATLIEPHDIGLHEDVEVVALHLQAGQRISVGGAEDRIRRKRVHSHHHPARETYLATCKGTEECLELVGMQGMDVIEYRQGFQTTRFTVPIDLDFSNCLEGLVGLARFFGDIIQRGWKKACSDGINGAFHAARAGHDVFCVRSTDLFELCPCPLARDEPDVA